MKKSILAVAMVIAGASCTPNPGPIEIYGFGQVDLASCLANEKPDVLLLAGDIDVSSGIPKYPVGILMRGFDELNIKEVVRSDSFVLSTDKRDAFIFDSLELSYKATPSIGTLKSDSIPIFGSAGAVLTANIISPKIYDALNSINTSTDPKDTVRLAVTVEVKGHMSKTRTPFTSGQAVFNLNVTKTTTCPMNGFKYTKAECGTSGAFGAPVCCDPAVDADCKARP